jgi:hypothetical protein
LIRVSPRPLLDANAEEARVLLAKHLPPLVLAREGSTWSLRGGFDLSLMLDEEGSAAEQTGAGGRSTISRVGGTGYLVNRRPAITFEVTL